MKCVSTTVKTCSGKFQWILLILSLEDSKFLYKILKVTIFLIMFFITEIFLYCFIVRFYQLLFWKPDTYHIQELWNRDKYHIIWSAKNLIKNTQKRTIEYISQPQSKAWTWNYIFHVPVHLPSNCYRTRTQSPLSCNKQMTQLAIRQKLYIYIYIFYCD